MRPSGRKLDELRNVVIEINPMRHAEGTCLLGQSVRPQQGSSLEELKKFKDLSEGLCGRVWIVRRWVSVRS